MQTLGILDKCLRVPRGLIIKSLTVELIGYSEHKDIHSAVDSGDYLPSQALIFLT